MEDETGRLDVIIRPDLYDCERDVIRNHGILALRGRLGKEDGVTNLRAESFYPVRMENASKVVPSHDFR